MASIGSLSVGLVWGWLSALVVWRSPRPWDPSSYLLTGLPLWAATAVLMIGIYTLVGSLRHVYFTGGHLFALLLHFGILQGIALRSSS